LDDVCDNATTDFLPVDRYKVIQSHSYANEVSELQL